MAKRVNPTAAHRLLVSQGMVQNFLRPKKKAKLHDFFLGEKKLTSPLLTTLSEKQMCNRFSSIFIHIWVGNHMEPLWSGFGDKLRQQLWQCHPATPKNPAEAQLQ